VVGEESRKGGGREGEGRGKGREGKGRREREGSTEWRGKMSEEV
jgi:hypothetical protein